MSSHVDKILARFSGPCVYCGTAAQCADHVRALSRGGLDHASNLVPACAPCNLSKGSKLLTDWRPDLLSRGIVDPRVLAEWYRILSGAEGAPPPVRVAPVRRQTVADRALAYLRHREATADELVQAGLGSRRMVFYALQQLVETGAARRTAASKYAANRARKK